MADVQHSLQVGVSPERDERRKRKNQPPRWADSDIIFSACSEKYHITKVLRRRQITLSTFCEVQVLPKIFHGRYCSETLEFSNIPEKKGRRKGKGDCFAVWRDLTSHYLWRSPKHLHCCREALKLFEKCLHFVPGRKFYSTDVWMNSGSSLCLQTYYSLSRQLLQWVIRDLSLYQCSKIERSLSFHIKTGPFFKQIGQLYTQSYVQWRRWKDCWIYS